MAYTAGGLSQISSVNGLGLYRYDSLDALADVDGSGYFNNSDDSINLRVGDIIHVFDWDTAVRTGTVADMGTFIVMTVSAAGVVNLSNDMLAGTLATGD